jgi:hypothetical protein
MIRSACLIAALFLLTACGGGSSSTTGSAGAAGSSTGTATTTTSGGSGSGSTTAAGNTAVITVDSGPTSLQSGANGYLQDNFAYVTVTVCAPGSATNCQTIDHVQIDTGSVGLRILAPVLNASLLSALPLETDTQGNGVGECFGFVDSYTFGSVRQADVSVGGEKVSGMPFQAVADTGQFATVPSLCSSGAGAELNSVNVAGANGILGIGLTPTDCGSSCAVSGGYSAAIYYDCPASGCAGIIARSSSASAPFQQLPNLAAALGVDNNGVIVSLPAAAAGGQTSLTGTLYFGIGTETNNALGSATVLPTTTDSSRFGTGFVTANFNGQNLNQSYIDSGTSLYLFSDSAITACTGSYAGYYCPAATETLSLTLQGQNTTSEAVSIQVANAQALLSTTFAALPGLAGNPNTFSGGLTGYNHTFALGLPFFFGRNIYFGIEGASAGSVSGPFFAF